MVARWKTPGHPLKVTEYRLYQRDGKLLLETIYEDGSGRDEFEEMKKSGDVLRYITKDTRDPETGEIVTRPYDGVDFFKLPGGAIELWDDEGKWITAAPAPACWKFYRCSEFGLIQERVKIACPRCQAAFVPALSSSQPLCRLPHSPAGDLPRVSSRCPLSPP
jgi:hypothetical protein